MKINYQNMLLDLLANLDYQPRLLLHSCCGPCSTQVLSLLAPYFDITVLYYNPNIEPFVEYEKRKNEQIRFIKDFHHSNIHFLDCDYDNEVFHEKVKGLENAKEGSFRCPSCFLLRLEKTAALAKSQNYEYFGTTLTVSPHKNSGQINKIGAFLEKKYDVKYLYSDFKKQNGYQKSVDLSKEYNLYRQNYCGCLYGRDFNENS